jgi:hypothetical protein
MYHDGRIRSPYRPSIHARCLAHNVHGTAGVESRRQSGTCVKAVALVIEGRGTAPGRNVGFQDGYIHSGPGQERCGGQPAYTAAYHDDPAGRAIT